MKIEQHGSRAPVYVLIACVCALELFAMRAQDPDFYFPDPFRPLVIGLLLVFVAVDRLRSARSRVPAFIVLFGVPVVALVLEWRTAVADARSNPGNVMRSENPVLRFHYRPGYDVRERAADGTPIAITADGLWDRTHAMPKPPGTFRIVLLGDSVPNDASVPFSSRFPRVLETKLAERFPDKKIEVVNVSCEGFNTVQEIELLERVGLAYQPDLVVLAYVLNDPFIQDGSYRRMGNSFFLFRMAPLGRIVTGGSYCPLFETLHRGYAFDLVVRNSLTRLRLLAGLHKFRVLVATLPIVERFDDPACLSIYDRVLGIAREQGFAAVRVVDAFAGQDHNGFLKPDDRFDITHPNVSGHERMGRAIADAAAGLVQ